MRRSWYPPPPLQYRTRPQQDDAATVERSCRSVKSSQERRRRSIRTLPSCSSSPLPSSSVCYPSPWRWTFPSQQGCCWGWSKWWGRTRIPRDPDGRTRSKICRLWARSWVAVPSWGYRPELYQHRLGPQRSEEDSWRRRNICCHPQAGRSTLPWYVQSGRISRSLPSSCSPPPVIRWPSVPSCLGGIGRGLSLPRCCPRGACLSDWVFTP